MSDLIKVVGGPLDGNSVGPWSPYPDRIVFEYDCVRNPAALQLISSGSVLEEADRLVAEYDFDRDWNAYLFAGWTVKRTPSS